MKINEHLFVFVLAGGSGERFWPLSRKKTPKQLLRLFSDNTLLGDTTARVKDIAPPENVFVLTNAQQVEGTRAALGDFPAGQIIGEPAKRDTAPAAALATAIAHSRDPEAMVVLLPADHLIKDTKRFQENILDAAAFAGETGALMTVAIKPAFPSTGFGYLELGEELEPGAHGTRAQRVKRFVEKPDAETAKSYVKSGNFAWNGGMFVWRASTFRDEAARLCPELAAFIDEFPAGDAGSYLTDRFPSLPKISVDYAIMEKASMVIAAHASFDWDDVGAWTAVAPHLPSDADGNASRGKLVAFDSKNNITFAGDRTVALCGVEDLVVVEVDDAVLVCHRDKVQQIKKLLANLDPELL
jgi:mannose-1-phosphate guanylyltransferase